MKKIKSFVSLILIFVFMVSTTITANAKVIDASFVRNYDNQRAVMYLHDDGRVMIYIGGSCSWRNHNPGNLESGEGSIGDDGRFAIFPTYSEGYKAMKNLIFGRKYINKTISDMIKTYAPEPENDTEKYIKFLVKRTGMDRNTKLCNMNSTQRKDYLAAIKKYEGYIVGSIKKRYDCIE